MISIWPKPFHVLEVFGIWLDKKSLPAEAKVEESSIAFSDTTE